MVPPVIIVGGGPAGTAAAITLARAHVRPALIERAAGDRDVVCGGFLSWDTLGGLERLGLSPAKLGAHPIQQLRLVAGDHIVETMLPAPAAGLSRRRLDSALLALAEEAGAEVRRGFTVRTIDGGRTIRLDNGEELAAEALFLATGKHELRGAGGRLAKGRGSPAVGLRAVLSDRADLERALAGVIELHLFDGGYAGLLVQEEGMTNFCMSVSRARLSVAGSPQALMAELVAESRRLADRVGDMPVRWAAVAGVPYGWRARRTERGLFRVGDQAAVIASLAGDGIAMALASGRAAAEAYLAGGPEAAGAYQCRFAGRARRAILVGEAMRTAAERPKVRAAMMSLLELVPALARMGAHATRLD